MKILYVVGKLNQEFGGGIINRRNLEVLQASGHEVSVCQIPQYQVEFTQRLYDRFCGMNGGLSRLNVQEVLECLEKNRVDVLFISHSLYGIIAKRIKNKYPYLQVITFFHNVEVKYALEMLKANKRNLASYLNLLFVYRAEFLAVRYSNYLLALNCRDARQIQKIYKKSVSLLLPTTFKDQGRVEKDVNVSSLTYLFVGSDFFANIHGITWFIRKVMPLTKGRLLVVGQGMEALSHLASDRIDVIGTVVDLKDWYAKADIVVCPLFLGSGMKTKTAEAMMYGRAIVGTREAFVGYEVDATRVGGSTESHEEMAAIMNALEEDRSRLLACQEYAREVFLDRYALDSTVNVMKQFLDGLKKK